MKKVSEAVISVDQMGITPQFLINRKTEYKTLTGGILSILLIIFYIMACIVFGEELIKKQNPTVLISSIFQNEPEQFNLTKKNFGFFVGLQGSDYEYYIDPTVYNLKMRLRTKRSYLDDKGKFQNEYKSKTFLLEKCDLEKNFPNFKNEFKDNDLNNLLCAPKEINEIILQGSFDNSLYRWFDFSVRICKNSTESDIICKTQEEIDKKLQGGFFVINYIDTIFDHKDYENPYKYIRKNYYTSMSNKFVKSITFWLRNIDYITDGGILFEEKEKLTYVNTEDIKENIDIVEANKIIGAVFRLSYTKEIIRRRYLKVQQVIAEVGGFIKGINIILSILFYFYTKMDFYNNILNEMYIFDSNNSDIYKKKSIYKSIKELNIKESDQNRINSSSKNPIRNDQNLIPNLRLNIKRKDNNQPLGNKSNSEECNNDKENFNNALRANEIDDNNPNPNLDINIDELDLIKKIKFNKETRKDFGFVEKLGILLKMCFPFRKSRSDYDHITYASLDLIMEKFDCVRFLRIYEELKILKKLIMSEEEIKLIEEIIKYKKNPYVEYEDKLIFNKRNVQDCLKAILPNDNFREMKIKTYAKRVGFI